LSRGKNAAAPTWFRICGTRLLQRTGRGAGHAELRMNNQ
jgi:hypothetical protein